MNRIRYKKRKSTKVWPYNDRNFDVESGDLMVDSCGRLYHLVESNGRNKRDLAIKRSKVKVIMVDMIDLMGIGKPAMKAPPLFPFTFWLEWFFWRWMCCRPDAHPHWLAHWWYTWTGRVGSWFWRQNHPR